MDGDTKLDLKVLTPKYSLSSDWKPLSETLREEDLQVALEEDVEGDTKQDFEGGGRGTRRRTWREGDCEAVLEKDLEGDTKQALEAAWEGD